MCFIYQGSICSDLNDIKTTVQDIINKLKSILEDEDLIFDLKLILNELMINSVIHGNKRNREKCVNLYLEVAENSIKIKVSDEGQGIDYDISSYNPEELKCCGRGLVLVNGLSDEFHIDKNKVEVIKYIFREN